MKIHRNRKRAFTLIELLTVIAIIAILAGLLFPAIRSALVKAEVVQAQTEVKTIETALKSYYTEYGKWPNGNGNATDFSYGKFGLTYTGYCENYWLMNTLRAIADSDPNNPPTCGNGNHLANPKRIVFLEVKAKSLDLSGNFLDPWGKPYQITTDTGYDNSCTNLANTLTTSVPTPAGTNITAGVANRSVVVWSFGPDGVAATKDDVTSWQ